MFQGKLVKNENKTPININVIAKNMADNDVPTMAHILPALMFTKLFCKYIFGLAKYKLLAFDAFTKAIIPNTKPIKLNQKENNMDNIPNTKTVVELGRGCCINEEPP